MFNRRLFLLMFAIVSLLSMDYAILRSARSALVVADLGKGALSIPIFELFGTMPASILMVFILTKLLTRFSMHKVFFLTLQAFALFFVVFAFVLHPIGIFATFFSMSFFVMAELWKIALLTVLFWGFINQYVPLDEAKKFYSPLMLGGSIGTLFAGPVISLCTRGTSWGGTLHAIAIALAVSSFLIAWCYRSLSKRLVKVEKEEAPKAKLTLIESVRAVFSSRYLMLLGWITIADYVAYAVGETIFLDTLKARFPNPKDYCEYMGTITSWCGALTAFSALVITPYVLRKFHWVVAALVPALCIFVTETLFLGAVSWQLNIEIITFLGAAFFAISRAAKSTLLDTSKEISFLHLSPLEKMQGKLVVDGMCSRVGRGGASVVSIGLAQIAGGVIASAALATPIICVVGVTCIFATKTLGKLIDAKSASATLKT